MYFWWISPKSWPATVFDVSHMFAYVDNSKKMTHHEHLRRHLIKVDHSFTSDRVNDLDIIVCDQGYVYKRLQDHKFVTAPKKNQKASKGLSGTITTEVNSYPLHMN